MRFILYLFSILFLISACSRFSSNDDNPVDLRSLTWEADTLWHEGELQIQMENIFGTGLNNILIAGHAAGPEYSIYTYDQGKIKVEPFHSVNGGNISYFFDAQDVFSFSENDRWACGPGDIFLDGNYREVYRVIRFNGEQWEDIPFESTPTDPSRQGLISIWGVNPNDVWFGGYAGVIFHWDGSLIRRDSLPDRYIADPENFLHHTDFTGDPYGNVYCLMRNMDSTATYRVYYLYKLEANHWQRLNRTNEAYMSIDNIWCSPSGTLYGAGTLGIRKFNFTTNGWEWFKEFPMTSSHNIFGTSDNNLIAITSHTVYHYDGITWQEISALRNTDVRYRSVWTDGKEVFVVAQYNWKYIVYHGK